jgi:hypothetical protein
MKFIERPAYTKNVDVDHHSDYELRGFFTYPCVHGGSILQTFPQGGYYGDKIVAYNWANSNPVACTFADKDRVDIMISRKFAKQDYKGIYTADIQDHVTKTNFQFYVPVANDYRNFWQLKKMANSKVNEPVSIFSKEITIEEISKQSAPSSLLSTVIDFSALQRISYHADIADVKLMRHNLVENITDYEIVFVIRNILGEHLSVINSIASGTIFKNNHVDLLKSGRNKYANKCNSDWQVLEKEKYPLKALENEYVPIYIKPDNFYGLNPYEMAEFRIVTNQTLRAIEDKVSKLEKPHFPH